MKALEEFRKLQENGVYTIATIKSWLIKYVGRYQELKLNWKCNKANCAYKSRMRCTCEKKEDVYIFLTLFESLLCFSKYHKWEHYAVMELKEYGTVKYDNDLVKKWVRRNESICTIDCFELLLSHYDYDLDPHHLLVMGNTLLGYEVFVDRKDFKNLIEFLDIFNDLFWVKMVYPESETLDFLVEI